MIKFYAVCNVNGPISARLNSDTLDSAMQEFGNADSRAWVDGASTDAEDDLDIDGSGMSESEFDSALIAAGCVAVRDLSEVTNGHSGRSYHISDGWYLWSHHAAN